MRNHLGSPTGLGRRKLVHSPLVHLHSEVHASNDD